MTTQRPIEFRVWDSVKKEWVMDFTTSDHLKVMQFTGLKDKNGKDIYEGDIVAPEKDSDGSYHYPHKPFSIEYMLLENCGDCTFDSGIGFNFYLNDPSDVEIVGNKFEHPELLNDETN